MEIQQFIVEHVFFPILFLENSKEFLCDLCACHIFGI